MTHRLWTTLGALVATLALSGSVATAHSPAQTSSQAAAGHSAHSCRTDDQAAALAARPARADEAKAHQAELDTDADETDEPDEKPENGERPQNHGWYVSQAARDHSTTGRDHGKAVSQVARSDSGKPEAAGH